MSDVAARLVDRVLPQVACRQWVLAYPKRLRLVLAHDAAAYQLRGAGAPAAMLRPPVPLHRLQWLADGPVELTLKGRCTTGRGPWR